MSDVLGLLTLFAGTIVVGYVGRIIAQRTGLSDAIWLLALGLLLGPILNIANGRVFSEVLPFLSPLALIFVLFDAGLGLDLRGATQGLARCLFIVVCSMAPCAAAVAGVSMLFGFDPLEGLLLGVILSGTSSVTVVALTEKLPASATAKTALTLESVLSDPLVIVIPLTLIAAVVPEQAGGAAWQESNAEALQTVVSVFSIGALAGIVAGFGWSAGLSRLPDEGFEYVLTLAVLFLLYVGCEMLGGSGAIAALVFGIVLANSKRMAAALYSAGFDLKQTDVREFHAELAFFIRSFFFVFLGIIAAFRFEPLLLGGGIVVAAAGARFLGVGLGTLGMKLEPGDRKAMIAVFPRGLAAAVVAHVAVERGVPHAEVLIDVVVIVILGTTLLSTVAATALAVSARRRARPPEPAAVADAASGSDAPPAAAPAPDLPAAPLSGE